MDTSSLPAPRATVHAAGPPPNQVTRRPRTKTNPFRILAYALFARQDWVSRLQDGDELHVCLQNTGMRLALGIQSERFRSYLQWLQQRGYIRDLHLSRGRSEFAVRNAGTWNWCGESDDSTETADA